MKLWVVGEVKNPDMGCDIWEFCGVFDTEKKAIAACTSGDHFIGPVDLNFLIPNPTEDWPNSYYPLVKDENK